MHYWHLINYENEHIPVKPENVELVQKKLATGEGFIRTPTRSIAVRSIKDFVESDEPYTDQKLLEGASQAFNDPLITKDGIKARIVKKSVPARKWNSYYSHIPSYHFLSTNDTYVMMYFTLPVHLIDHEQVEELTEQEEINLSRRV